MSSPQPSRIGNGIITSRSSIAMSTDVSEPRVSRNAGSECVNRSRPNVSVAVTGSPNTVSRSWTGNGVESRARTCPGRWTTNRCPTPASAAASVVRRYRWRPPPGPNHSSQTRVRVQREGILSTGKLGNVARTYWCSRRCLALIPIRDRGPNSFLTAKIAWRISSVTLGWPIRSRVQRPSAQASSRLSPSSAVRPCRVRRPRPFNPSISASCAGIALSSSTLACRR